MGPLPSPQQRPPTKADHGRSRLLIVPGEAAVIFARACRHTGDTINTVYCISSSTAGLICSHKSITQVPEL